MPKKKNQETQAEQSERFKKAAQDMIDAGDLDPDEADGLVSRILAGSKTELPVALEQLTSPAGDTK